MLLYILYTFLMAVGLIILIVVMLLTKGKRMARNVLLSLMPIVILIQFYYWNSAFNHYVKSYLFSSKEFTCKYVEGWNNLSIPLPKRTVFLGKEDACSPFYLTYLGADHFNTFYQKELETLKNKGEIQRYRYGERKDSDGMEHKEYIVELSSGSTINITFTRDTGDRFIAIDYKSNR